MKIVGVLMLVCYILIASYIYPPKWRPFDVFKLSPNLLPFWTKIVAVVWIIFVIFHANFIKKIEWVDNHFLSVGVNLGLLVITFAKDKLEDEFSMQIRWRAMYTSMISFFVFIGIGGTIRIILPESDFDNGFYFLFMWLNAVLTVNICYYYYSRYKFKKGN
nr:hypothetical protein [uncultured Draconibacterium sp.]